MNPELIVMPCSVNARSSGGSLPSSRRGHARNRQSVFARELEIALVLARRRHDRAGAVTHQDVIGNPDRDVFIGEDVVRVRAGEDAGLFLDRGQALDLALAAGRLDVIFNLGALLRGR